MRQIMRLIRDKQGVTAIEYAMIASLISIAAIGAFQNLGDRVDAKFQAVNSAL